MKLYIIYNIWRYVTYLRYNVCKAVSGKPPPVSPVTVVR